MKDRVHLHDLHATILHLMGLDHERLTNFHQCRDESLADIGGKVVTACSWREGVDASPLSKRPQHAEFLFVRQPVTSFRLDRSSLQTSCYYVTPAGQTPMEPTHASENTCGLI